MKRHEESQPRLVPPRRMHSSYGLKGSRTSSGRFNRSQSLGAAKHHRASRATSPSHSQPQSHSPQGEMQMAHLPTPPASNDMASPQDRYRMNPRSLRLHLDLTTPGRDLCDGDGLAQSVVVTEAESLQDSDGEPEDADIGHPKAGQHQLTLETFELFSSEEYLDEEEGGHRPSATRPEMASLCALANAEGAVYYIRNHAVEKAQIAMDEDFRHNSSARAPELADIVQPQCGVPSCYTWDTATPHTGKVVVLSNEDASATCIHSSTQGSVVGSRSFSEGIHIWHIEATDIHTTCFGVVSKLGTEQFQECATGGLPQFVACMRPGTLHEHTLHWFDCQGRAVSRAVEPPLSTLSTGLGATLISVAVDFTHKEITFLCNDVLVDTLSLRDAGGAIPDSEILLGDHTVFCHVKGSATVTLLPKFYRTFDPFSSLQEGLPQAKILAGNPYVRWSPQDGVGIEASFGLPLGICVWNQHLWVTDCDSIRQIDMKGCVTTHYPRLQPHNSQPPVQYFGAIQAMRGKLYVGDVTNRTILCIDPTTWEAKAVFNKGEHAFRTCSEGDRRELYDLILQMRTYDVATASLPQSMEPVVAGAIRRSNRKYQGSSALHFPLSKVSLGLAQIPPAWLFVTDSANHCVYYADLSANRMNVETRNTPAICVGKLGEFGRADGQGTDARFRHPTSIVSDPTNLLLYIADTSNSRIAKVQLVWNDTRRTYSGQVTTLQTSTREDDREVNIKIQNLTGLALHNETGNYLLTTEPGTDKMYQVHLQPSLKAMGPTFASPYDHLLMMLKRAREDAENMNLNMEHCRTIARAVDLLMSTPNIYQVEYVGGTLDGDVAKFLSDTYAPLGMCEEDEGAFGGKQAEQLEESVGASARLANITKPVRFGTDSGPSKVLGLEIPNLDSLHFNVFEVSGMCEEPGNGGILVQVAMNIFSKYRFFTKYFGTPELMHRLIQFLTKVQAGYHRDNHYHNQIHAADVLQTVHWMINTAGLVAKMSDVDCIAILLSAVIHDYDHPGVNNAFLVNTKDDIALHFNDQSVLENHHLFLTFQLLRVETYSILDMFTDLEQRVIRESMISYVLATDMKHHFKFIGELKVRRDTVREDPAAADFMSNTDDKMMILKNILHAADISNPVKPKNISVDWAKRVMKEFRDQGKREEDLELAVSPFCDKGAEIARCQKGFIEFVVRPLFALIVETYPALKPMLDNLDANLQHWKDQDGPPLNRTGSLKRRKSGS